MHRFGILLIVGLVTANDLVIGPKDVGKTIYNELKEASPAIWRQMHNVTINATSDEIINSINIIDLRPNKDGEANIVDGGVGHQNVTIELKSPAVFRGYTFQIKVVSVPVSEYKGYLPEHKIGSTVATEHEDPSQKVPILITKDLDNTRLVRKSDDTKSTSTITTEATISTLKPEPTNYQTSKMQEVSTKTIKSIDDLSTLPTTPSTLSDDFLKPIPTVLTKVIPDIKSIDDLPTTEDDAQLIGINEQNTVGIRLTHEEQDTRDGDLYTAQVSAVTVANEPTLKEGSKDVQQATVSHINPSIPTAQTVTKEQDVLTPILVSKQNSQEKLSNNVSAESKESHQQKELNVKQNVPLPYVNH